MMQLSLIAGAIAIFFCGSAEQEAMQPTVVGRQLMDEAVIETVLVDVLTSSDDVSRRILREQGGEQLIFDNECYDHVFSSTKAVHMSREKWEFPKLAAPSAVHEAGENVLDRIKRKELYEPFKPQDKRISISKGNPESMQPRNLMSARPIRVGPPGYADENRLAVVVLSVPMRGMHVGFATYLLHFDGMKWNVIARHIFFVV